MPEQEPQIDRERVLEALPRALNTLQPKGLTARDVGRMIDYTQRIVENPNIQFPEEDLARIQDLQRMYIEATGVRRWGARHHEGQINQRQIVEAGVVFDAALAINLPQNKITPEMISAAGIIIKGFSSRRAREEAKRIQTTHGHELATEERRKRLKAANGSIKDIGGLLQAAGYQVEKDVPGNINFLDSTARTDDLKTRVEIVVKGVADDGLRQFLGSQIILFVQAQADAVLDPKRANKMRKRAIRALQEVTVALTAGTQNGNTSRVNMEFKRILGNVLQVNPEDYSLFQKPNGDGKGKPNNRWKIIKATQVKKHELHTPYTIEEESQTPQAIPATAA